MATNYTAIEEEVRNASGYKAKPMPKRQKYLLDLIKKCENITDDDWGTLSEEAQGWINQATKALNSEPEEDIPDFPDLPESAEPEKEAEPLEKEEISEDQAESESVETEEEDLQQKKENEEMVVEAKKKPAAAKAKAAVAKKAAASKKAPVKKAATAKAQTKAPAKKAATAEKKPVVKKAGTVAPRGGVSADGKISGIKFKIKKALLSNPNMSVDDIVNKLAKSGVEAPSKSTVASIRSETRHTFKVLKQEGVLDLDI